MIKSEKQLMTEIVKDVGKQGFDYAVNVISLGLWSPFKEVAENIWRKSKERDYSVFLLGLNALCEKEKLTKKEVDALIARLHDKNFDDHIATIIDSVYFSQSDWCRLILGFIAGKYIKDGHLDHADIILSSALKNLVDRDIDIFKKFYKMQDTKDSVVFSVDYDEIEEIVFAKLQSVQIFGMDLAGNRLMGQDKKMPLRFRKTIVSDRFNNYLVECETIEKQFISKEID